MALHSTKEVLQYLAALVVGTGIPACKIGVPASLSNVMSAFVTVGPQPYSGHTNHTYNRTPRFTIILGYMVIGSEETAELAIADAIDNITGALLADRTFGGLVQSVEWDTATGDSPEYRVYAGREFRLYPIVVQVKWTEQYGD